MQLRDWAKLLKEGQIAPVRIGLAQAVRILSDGDSTPAKRILTGLFEAWIDNLDGQPLNWATDRIYKGLKDVAKDIEDES